MMPRVFCLVSMSISMVMMLLGCFGLLIEDMSGHGGSAICNDGWVDDHDIDGWTDGGELLLPASCV